MQTQESSLFDLLTHWPVEAPFTLTPLAGGSNNQAWRVKTADGLLYVLRLAVGVSDLTHMRYEAALLRTLLTQSLPFSLPLPLLTQTGDILVPVEQVRAQPAIATLTPLLPGQTPARTLPNSASAGIALAQLNAALATIPAASLPRNGAGAQFQYGDLAHCHPLVPDPLTTLEQLLPPEYIRPLTTILRQSLNDWEMLAAQTLPQQVLHRDYGPENILIEDERVTAILDFEFAGVDRRVFELCVAISWWPVRLMGTGKEWEMIDTLGRAYTALVPLTDEELLVLPATLRMRDMTSLIYRVGRYLAGLETLQTIQGRAQHSLWREAWLLANQQILIQHALTWRKNEFDE